MPNPNYSELKTDKAAKAKPGKGAMPGNAGAGRSDAPLMMKSAFPRASLPGKSGPDRSQGFGKSCKVYAASKGI
jgi:hypothetical protein